MQTQNLIFSFELVRKMILLADYGCERIEDEMLAAWGLQDTIAVMGKVLTLHPVIGEPMWWWQTSDQNIWQQLSCVLYWEDQTEQFDNKSKITYSGYFGKALHENMMICKLNIYMAFFFSISLDFFCRRALNGSWEKHVTLWFLCQLAILS